MSDTQAVASGTFTLGGDLPVVRLGYGTMQLEEICALPVADIFAVYPERANLSAKVSAFIDFLTDWFGKEAAWADARR